jgi:hypothetical protein
MTVLVLMSLLGLIRERAGEPLVAEHQVFDASAYDAIRV